jgi:hypothetical protein
MPMLQDFRNSPVGLLAIWGLIVASGVYFLDGYATRPGRAADAVFRSTASDQIISKKRDARRNSALGWPVLGIDMPVGEESRR